jgi:hypothetical protein
MQLERIGGDMDGVLAHINGFSTWWSNMYTVLHSLKANVAHLQSSHLDMHRVKMIQHRWTTVQAQYYTYGAEISTLQDFYPALYLRSKSHFSDGLSVRLTLYLHMAVVVRIFIPSLFLADSSRTDDFLPCCASGTVSHSDPYPSPSLYQCERQILCTSPNQP